MGRKISANCPSTPAASGCAPRPPTRFASTPYSLRNLRSTTYDSWLAGGCRPRGFLPQWRPLFHAQWRGRLPHHTTSTAGGGWPAASHDGHVAGGDRRDRMGEQLRTAAASPRSADAATSRCSARRNPPIRTARCRRWRTMRCASRRTGHTLVVGDRGGELYLARLDGDAGQAGYRLRRLALPAPCPAHMRFRRTGPRSSRREADGTVSINDLTALLPTLAAPSGNVSLDQAEPADAVDAGSTVADSDRDIRPRRAAHGNGAVAERRKAGDGEPRRQAARHQHRLGEAHPQDPARRASVRAGADWKPSRQPLDESPYSTDGHPIRFLRNVRMPILSRNDYIVVYNASRSLDEAREARTAAADAGLRRTASSTAAGICSVASSPSRRRRRATPPCRASRKCSAELMPATTDLVRGGGSNRSSPVNSNRTSSTAGAILTGAEPPLSSPPWPTERQPARVRRSPLPRPAWRWCRCASRVPARAEQRQDARPAPFPRRYSAPHSTSTPTAAMPASVTRLVIRFQRRTDCWSAADEAPTAGWNVSTSHSYFRPAVLGQDFRDDGFGCGLGAFEHR